MIDFDNLEDYRESNRIEAKLALGGLPESIWETYSAFANTFGGLILLGVEEYPDKSLHPVDLPDPIGIMEEFWTKVNDPRVAGVNILTLDDIKMEEADGKTIIVIRVPMAPHEKKPVYIGRDPFFGSYYRSGDGDYRFTEEEVEAMLSAARE